jgi:hemerythrin
MRLLPIATIAVFHEHVRLTMDHFAWKPEYALGDKDIDDQHHYFVGLINKFYSQFSQSRDTTYQDALIEELNAYARFHFISEENMMMRHAYPDYVRHKAHHRELLDQLGAKELRLALERTEQRKEEVVGYLIEWFLNHTNREDRQFTEYLQAHAA